MDVQKVHMWKSIRKHCSKAKGFSSLVRNLENATMYCKLYWLWQWLPKKLVLSGFLPTTSNIYSFFRATTLVDPFVDGIWANSTYKMSICLWRLLWKKLNCFNKLHGWGKAIPDLCLLCSREDEVATHLFVNRGYSESHCATLQQEQGI